MPNPPENDLLSLALNTSRLSTQVFFYDRLCDSWSINTSGSKRATFHLVGEGEAWLHLKNQHQPIRLGAGDLVIFPHDAWHVVSHQKDEKLLDKSTASGSSHYITLMCGYFLFENGFRNLVIEALPEMVLVRCTTDKQTERLEALVKLLFAEADTQTIGTQIVLDSLGNVLLIQAIRYFLNEQQELKGFFASITEPKILKVLQAIHEDPGKQWTVETLADIALMSRANFAQHFTALIGQSPMAYITEWRMRRAELLMRDRSQSVSEIAERFGYSNEAAFRRAFKRVWGVGPGMVRKFRS